MKNDGEFKTLGLLPNNDVYVFFRHIVCVPYIMLILTSEKYGKRKNER